MALFTAKLRSEMSFGADKKLKVQPAIFATGCTKSDESKAKTVAFRLNNS